MEPRSPTLRADSLPSELPGKPIKETNLPNLSYLKRLFTKDLLL